MSRRRSKGGSGGTGRRWYTGASCSGWRARYNLTRGELEFDARLRDLLALVFTYGQGTTAPVEEPTDFPYSLAREVGVAGAGTERDFEQGLDVEEHRSENLDTTPSGGRVDRYPEIHRHKFDHERLRGLYSEVLDGEESPAFIPDTGLPYAEEAAFLAEARCYAKRDPRTGRKFCYAPIAYKEMDRERIHAPRRYIEAERPDWVELMHMATMMDNEVHTIIHLPGVPPYPAVAILQNMKERGELSNA